MAFAKMFAKKGKWQMKGGMMTEKKKTSRPRNSFAEMNEQVRNWFLTINAHETNSIPTISADQISDAFRAIDPAADFVFQLERGESGGEQGYLHYQGVLLLSRAKPRRRRDVVRVLKESGIKDAHLEKVKKVGAAEAYCSKSKTRVSGPWWSSENFQERSVRKASANGNGAMADRLVLADAVDEGLTPEQIALDDSLRLFLTPANASFVQTIWAARQSKHWKTEERTVQVSYIWGSTGSGKTRFVHDAVPSERLYTADLQSRDPFGMYAFEPVLFLDEFRDSCDLSYLLRLLDRYPVQLDRRYANLWAAWDTVYICSNWPLEALYRESPEADRSALRRRITTITHMTGKED